MNKVENHLFFVVVLGIFIFGAFTMVKNADLFSEPENRNLTQFTHPTVGSFLDGTFQKSFEAAFSDQFLNSDDIRVNYRQAIASLPKFGLDNMVCKNNYLEIPNSKDRHRAIFNCEDYMVYFPELLLGEKEEIFEQNIKKYNHLNKISDVYYYFVNDSSVMNFASGEKEIDYEEIFKEKLKGKYHLAFFEYKDWEDYKQYFYKNDHHWNYKGSYKGYLEIAKLLGISHTIKPTGSFTVTDPYFGSFATMTQDFDHPDELTIYTFDIPDHDTMVNKVEGSYNHFDECKNHDYDYKNEYMNLYGFCYGDDLGEVVFDFHQPKKENLLIIANSYSNPINELIAMNYNKTFVVDLRYYKAQFGYDFDFEEYVKDNHINKTLFIFSPTFIRNKNTNQGLKP